MRAEKGMEAHGYEKSMGMRKHGRERSREAETEMRFRWSMNQTYNVQCFLPFRVYMKCLVLLAPKEENNFYKVGILWQAGTQYCLHLLLAWILFLSFLSPAC